MINSIKTLKIRLNKVDFEISAERYKVLSMKDKVQFTLNCFWIFGLLIFPIRYLLYAIRWSLRILKQE